MKKLFWVSVIVVLLISVIPVRAMETNTYLGSVGLNPPYILDLTTFRAGNFTAHIVWTPKKNGNYIFQVFRYTDPSNVYQSKDPNYNCFMQTYLVGMPPAGDWTCQLLNAPAGYYRIYFRTYGGTVNFNLTVTAETNP